MKYILEVGLCFNSMIIVEWSSEWKKSWRSSKWNWHT